MGRLTALAIRAVASVAAAAIAASCASAPVRSPPSVPLRVSEGGLLFLPVTLGGFGRAELVLDLGAGLDVVSPRLLKSGSVDLGRTYGAVRMTGERIDLPLFRIPDLTIGPVRRDRALVGSWPLLETLGIDGILSARFLEGHVVTMDLGRNLLIFEGPRSAKARMRAGRIVPLELSRDGDRTLDLFADFSFGRRVTGRCEIDTGLTGFVVHSRYMEALGPRPGAPGVERIERPSLTGAMELRHRAVVSDIHLASAPEVSVASPLVDFQDIRYDCAVGVSFWRGRAVTFDVSRRRLVVAPSVR